MTLKAFLIGLAILTGCDKERDDPPAPTPTPVATPTAAPSPSPSPKASPKATPKRTPFPISPPIVMDYECSYFIDGRDGSGGFVNNPESEKGTLKIVWPERFSYRIVRVDAWTVDLSFKERLKRREPNEYNDRERYYGMLPIAGYPDHLIVGALLASGERVCVNVPDPQKRLD